MHNFVNNLELKSSHHLKTCLTMSYIYTPKHTGQCVTKHKVRPIELKINIYQASK